MTNVKDLRLRIGGVSATAKITKTMRMVASAELVKYKKLLPLAIERKRLLESHLFDLDPYTLSELSLLRGKNPLKKKKVKIILGSDRGLCGGFNTKMLKILNLGSVERPNGGNDIDEALIVVGKKISARVKDQKTKNLSCENGLLYTFELASYISELLLKFSDEYLLECSIIYSKFNNALSYEIVENELLPFSKNNQKNSSKDQKFAQLDIDDRDFASNLSLAYLKSEIHYALLSSKASEESSRFIAMDGATKNSNQIIETLTLQMNKIRQSTITRELIEIVSSSQAL